MSYNDTVSSIGSNGSTVSPKSILDEPRQRSISEGSFIQSSQQPQKVKNKLPLSKDFFHVPQLNEVDQSYLINLCQKSWKEMIHFGLNDTNRDWKFDGKHHGVSIYKSHHESRREKGALFKGVLDVDASREELIELLMTNTTEKYRTIGKQLNPDILDGLVLHTLIPTNEEKPHQYAVVKWVALHPPKSIVKPRDLCFLEYSDEFIDSNGRLTWAKSMHSVELSYCPSLHKTHGLIRGAIYRTGYIIRKSLHSSMIECINVTQFDPKGFIPMWFTNLACKRRVYQIYKFAVRVQQHRFRQDKFLTNDHVIPKHIKKACRVCERSFGALSRRYNCQRCGQVICHKCCREWKIEIQIIGKRKLHICTFCIIKSRKKQLKEFAKKNSIMKSLSFSMKKDKTIYSDKKQRSSSMDLITQSSIFQDEYNAPTVEVIDWMKSQFEKLSIPEDSTICKDPLFNSPPSQVLEWMEEQFNDLSMLVELDITSSEDEGLLNSWK